jgi:uncharacterized membrane protein
MPFRDFGKKAWQEQKKNGGIIVAISSISLTLFMLVVVLVAIALPVAIGVYVYKDAKSRNMDAALWTVIVVFLGFLGLIIYAVSRSGYESAECPSCRKTVAGDFVFCPHCGARLASVCGACGTQVEPLWRVCPKCGAELPQAGSQGAVAAAPRKAARGNDGKLIILLIASVVIAFILFFSVAAIMMV